MKGKNILRNVMGEEKFSHGLTLTTEYPQILDLIKTLPLYCRQWLRNMTHSQPLKKRKATKKNKHLKHSLKN